MRNILFVHGVSAIGGAERDLLSLIRNLSRLKYAPFVICPEGQLHLELKGLDIKVETMNIPPWRKGKYILSLPNAISTIRSIIVKNNIDLIHINDFWYFPITCLAARRLNIPMVTHIRQEIEVPKIKKYWLRYSDMVFAISENVKRAVIMSGIEESKVITLYSGIEIEHIPGKPTDIRRILNIDKEQPVIGTVANMYPRKGYEYLVEALAEIKKGCKDILCIIVGDGDSTYKSRIEELSVRLNVSNHIIYTGFQDDVYPYISAMDVFVLPSIMEGFGIVLLEAMAMSKPVVATTVGGIPEIVVDNITGLLVPPKTPLMLADAISNLLESKERRIIMGAAGRERVESLFSIKATIKKIECQYENVMTARRR